MDNPWIFQATSNPITSSTADGQPISWTPFTGTSGIITSQFATTTSNNGLDSTGTPGMCGQYSVVYIDPNATNPSLAMQIWIGSKNGKAVNVDSPTSGLGVVSGGTYPDAGTRPTKTIAPDNQTVTITYPHIRRLAATNLEFGLGLYASQPAGNWTIGQNLCIFGPGNEDNTISNIATGLDIDENFRRSIVSATGQVPSCLRPVLDFGSGILSVVNPGDERLATNFTFQLVTPSPTFPVVAVRYFNTDPSKGSIASGGDGTYNWPASTKLYTAAFGVDGTDPTLGPYRNLPATDNGALFDFNPGTVNDPWFVAEVDCGAPHGLTSGFNVKFPAGITTHIPWTGSTTDLNISNAGGGIFVTGLNTFIYQQFATASSGQTTVQTVNSTTPISVSFTGTVVDIQHVPWEAYADLCNQLGCDFYCTIPAYMSDTLQTNVFNRIKAHLTNPALKCIVAWVNELWNSTVYFESFAFANVAAKVWAYHPGTVVNQYFTSTSTAVGTYAAQTIKTASVHDLAAAVFGEAAFVRNFEGQWANGSIPTGGIMNALNTYQIPAGIVRGAPYYGRVNNVTAVASCDPAAGNWPAAWICESFKHEVKYNATVPAIFSSQKTLIQGYTGPTTGLAGAPISRQIGGKPAYCSYEASLENPIPGKPGPPSQVSNLTPLTRDCYYSPQWYDVERAYYASLQDGNPYNPGSGFTEVNAFLFTGGWDGGVLLQFVYAKSIWAGQQPGTIGNVGNTNTTTFALPNPAGGTFPNAAGETATPQVYCTLQGGGTGDGLAHDVTNDSWALRAWLDWIDSANAPPKAITAFKAQQAGRAMFQRERYLRYG